MSERKGDLPSDPVARQAIAWWVRLHSGMAKPFERRAWTAWIAEDPAHRQAWECLEAIGSDACRVPSAVAHAVLHGPPRPGRRDVLRGLAVAAGSGMIGMAGYRYAPWQRFGADLSTRIGERRTVSLSQALHITLNSDSALRLGLDNRAPSLHLLRGEVLIRTRTRPGGAALRVETGYGVLRTENARFDVRRTHRHACVGVYEGSALLWRAEQSVQVAAGERVVYGSHGELERRRADPDCLAWADGLVVAKDWSLARFAQYLARQRLGVIRVDPAVADLRLSGVFPLDDAERALKALEPVLPIVVTRHTQFWLQVSPRAV